MNQNIQYQRKEQQTVTAPTSNAVTSVSRLRENNNSSNIATEAIRQSSSLQQRLSNWSDTLLSLH